MAASAYFSQHLPPLPTMTMSSLSNQRRWEENLSSLINISNSTFQHNAELETRIHHLERELQVWKQAHAAYIDSSERESKARNLMISSLNQRLATSDFFQMNDPLVLCLLDGTELLFAPSLLSQGRSGGQLAGEILTKKIADHLRKEGFQHFKSLSFWTTWYMDKSAVLNAAVRNNTCTADQLDAFLSGFSQVSPRFGVVDTGTDNIGTVDLKIRESLYAHLKLPQTLRIFYGSAGYSHEASILSELDAHNAARVVLLQSGDQTFSTDSPHLFSSILMDDVFTAIPRILPPIISISQGLTATGGLVSPQSSSPSIRPRTTIDPDLPLHKHVPPPCNEFYLMSCSKGDSCKYSHDYDLTTEQLDSLAVNAKKAPCNWLKNGLQCPYGEQCCWGHSCPNGKACFHLGRGKCWFKGATMHDEDIPLSLCL